MNAHIFLIAMALVACSNTVFAQWQWMDDSGRKVFSDRPPPPHISSKQIIKQPHNTPRAAEKVLYPSADGSAPHTPTATLPAATEQAPAATPSIEESEDAAYNKALEEAQRKSEEAQRKQLEAQQAKDRKENCQRASTAQVSLQSEGLIAYVNEKGERGLMTEEQRQADLQRAQKAIKSNCK